MGGQLVQVATNTVTSAVSSVTLTGIDTDDVYMVAINNVIGSIDNQAVRFRLGNSGTPKTANYAVAYKRLRTDQAFTNHNGATEPNITIGGGAGINTGESVNCIIYLYNLNDSNEYSFGTFEPTIFMSSPKLEGNTGGFVHKVSEQLNEIEFILQSGNYTSGTFTLYKVI